MRYITVLFALFLFGAASALTVGCDRTISSQEKTKVDSNGNVQTDKETVKQEPNGNVVKEETHDTSHQ
jgi:hypothetical protein